MEPPSYQKPERFDDRVPRSNIRQEIQAAVRYMGRAGGKEVRAQAEVSNISEKGAFLIMPREEFPSGTMIHAAFRFPVLDSELLTTYGKVKYVKSLEGGQYGFGIEFVDLSEKTKLTIQKFVSFQQMNETF